MDTNASSLTLNDANRYMSCHQGLILQCDRYNLSKRCDADVDKFIEENVGPSRKWTRTIRDNFRAINIKSHQ